MIVRHYSDTWKKKQSLIWKLYFYWLDFTIMEYYIHAIEREKISTILPNNDHHGKIWHWSESGTNVVWV